jgi:hypothetical protein
VLWFKTGWDVSERFTGKRERVQMGRGRMALFSVFVLIPKLAAMIHDTVSLARQVLAERGEEREVAVTTI